MFVNPLTGRLVEAELRADDRELDDLRHEVEQRPWLQKVSVCRNKLSSLQPLGDLRDLVWLDASGNKLLEALDFAAPRCSMQPEASFSSSSSSSSSTSFSTSSLSLISRSSSSYAGSLLSFADAEQEGEIADEEKERIWPQGAGWTGSNLQVALLAQNAISRLEHVRAHVNLRVLDLSHNQIVNVCDLSPLRHLEELDLSHNCLDTLNGLGSLEELRVLRVDHNYLRDLREVRLLNRLQELTAADNELRHLEGLEMCTSLQVLRVSQNHLKQIALLAPLEHLQMLGTLELLANPCASKTFYRLRVLYRLQQLDFLDGEEATPPQKVRARCLFGSDLEQRMANFAEIFPERDFVAEVDPFQDEEEWEREVVTETAIGLAVDVTSHAVRSCTALLLPRRLAEMLVEDVVALGLATVLEQRLVP
ncbi:Leucine-rich repeat-containing protein 1 [Hondaea fermentalgiana]|uniref:Leucine-rich repeat-containing protein 1 n=1 Tax=Hondaea fermentalgiana TaxID=2315210 RepID=A0A2R5H1T3_9STRA|nr:Leucine-rich repeat-containing protein 1 [Hondaea fermentalgiana]|eukprot:GBG34781.1 Leucine-rich repeat-containing protein 1 [Hondaea fermentalgiana]